MGRVAERAQAWVDSLGELSPRRGLLAAKVIRLAQAMDESTSGSGTAAASKELQNAVGALLGSETGMPLPKQGEKPTEKPAEKTVSRTQSKRDELAEKRINRQRKAAGQ